MMNKQSLEKLDLIPHLDLTSLLRPPVDELLADFHTVQGLFRPFAFDEAVVGDPGAEVPATYTSTYQVIDVIGWSRQRDDDLPIPRTVRWIRSFSGADVKARITRVAARSSASWHKHAAASASDSRHMLLHVPLATNTAVRFGVRDGEAPGSSEFWQHYGVGEAWAFNSNGFHTVENDGDTDRCHLYVSVPRDDRAFAEILDRAVAAYHGPLLSG